MNAQQSTKPSQQKKMVESDSKNPGAPVPTQPNPWQATFTKRLPYRVGQPLSSGGGGDGIMP